MARPKAPELFDPAPASAHGGDDLGFAPLAERMRPRTLDELVGQRHLLGPGRLLRRAIEADRIPSMILWGPPGTGKTTLARLLAAHTGSAFESISAVGAGVKEIREVVERARVRRRDHARGTLLFIDEIHRFNKSQQDALLPHVEAGVCVLVGATTENPSFEVNAALLSRARVLALQELGIDDLVVLLQRALGDAERGLGGRGLAVDEDLLRGIAASSQGDARRALADLEAAVDALPEGETTVTAEHLASALGRRALRYDKAGEEHYNVVSAFIKSMRASDADAAVYWLVRMLEAGEDPMFVARRIVIFAAEDVGNADPQGLLVASAAASATHLCGLPEAALHLTQATLYLSLAPKSNSALRSYAAARKDVQRFGALPVPMAVRNAVTRMMKDAGYGSGYRYPHDFDGGVDKAHESYLPEALARGPTRDRYALLGALGWEHAAKQRLRDDDDEPEPEG
ncbi:MAG TPA: replication-associated recombination protein A [Nannocystaceae bacterium]|nr:replication-associated recombination protein A [Nannocystaceae bacterium]